MSIPLISVPSPRFHEARLVLHVLLPLSQETLSLSIVLAGVLTHATAAHPTLRSRLLAKGEAHGGTVVAFATMRHALVDLAFIASAPAGLDIESGTLAAILSLLRETLCAPLLVHGTFDEAIVKQEVAIAKSALHRRAEDKGSLALHEAHEFFAPSADPLGTLEDFDLLTPERLTRFYAEAFAQASFYAEALGAFPPAVMEGFLASLPFSGKELPGVESFYDLEVPSPCPCREKTVRDNLSQSWLVSSYRVPVTSLSPERTILSVALSLLGGSYSSLLFHRIREEKGLCYTISASPYGSDPAFFIMTGLQKKDIPCAEREIARALADVAQGAFTDELLASTKQSLDSDFLSLADHLASSDFFQTRSFIRRTPCTLESTRQALSDVTREDIARLMAHATCEAVYRLEEES